MSEVVTSEARDGVPDSRTGIGRGASGLIGMLRLAEAVLMIGFSLVAGVLGATAPTFGTVKTLASVAFCLALVSVSVYAANGWAGWHQDANDPKFTIFRDRATAAVRRNLGLVSLVFLTIGTFAWTLLLGRTAVAVVPMWLLWLAYSHPRGLKRIPLGGTVAHLAAGPWMFLVPYSIFREVDGRGLVYATAFTLAFGSGHLNHELVDRMTDSASGLRTTAVAFGARFAHRAGTILAACAYTVIGLGAALGLVPTAEALPFLAAGAVHVILGGCGLWSEVTPERAMWYRTRYRLVFAAGVTGAVVMHILQIAFR